jgi:hypothetical protein
VTLLQRASLVCILGCATFSTASDVPKSILPDNVILCAPEAGCTNHTLFGRHYKVLSSSRFTVMVSISQTGPYTRADISIANNSGYPFNLSPDDFRVEVVTPKPRILLYVAPDDLKDLPPQTLPAARDIAIAASAKPILKTVSLSEAAPSSRNPTGINPGIDELYEKKEAALREAIEQAAAQKDLAAASISPNEVIRGRVFFTRDKRARQVNIVLPIAGAVFEFPYLLQH